MKILQIIQKGQLRGAEIFACQLSEELIKLGHEVDILILSGTENKLTKFKLNFLFANANLNKRFYDFKTYRKIAKVIKNGKYDIVQANASDTLKYAVFSKLLFRWKTPIIFRNASEIGKYLKSPFQKYFNYFLLKHVGKVISVSQASMYDLYKHFPFLKNKTMIIPIGINHKVKINTINLQPTNKKHIVHVGGFTFEKNHARLLIIFKNILKTTPEVHLHLIGDGPLLPKIKKLAIKLGLNNKVTFHGFVNNPLDYISAANLLILPSIIEGLPSVILESMFCKTPVIAYNVGGISEIINKKTGYLIDLKNEKDFSHQVIEIINNPDYEVLSFAHQYVLNNFTNIKIARKFEKEYQQLLKSNA
jgi:glycosyltransferase involved in cell wall biosynthesis